MNAIFLFAGGSGDLDQALYGLALLACTIWLIHSLATGLLRFRGPGVRRTDDPFEYWLGCGLLALLILAVGLEFFGIVPKNFGLT